MTVAAINALFAACHQPAVKLYIGMDAGTIQGRRFNLLGPRMFSAAYGPNCKYTPEELSRVDAWCDCGIFSDVKKNKFLSPADALARQLRHEANVAKRCQVPEFRYAALASRDRLIDEKNVNGKRKKQRWTVEEAESAVEETIEGAAFFDAHRATLAPRKLIMGCQGVDAQQYEQCAEGVLKHCKPGDIFGLGGWCILGLFRSWLPTFWDTIRRVVPMIASAGLVKVHIYGVMWRVPLGGLLWLCDRHKLILSTDSKKAAGDLTFPDPKKAGALATTWEENCRLWQQRLANLRRSEFYREPPKTRTSRQALLF